MTTPHAMRDAAPMTQAELADHLVTDHGIDEGVVESGTEQSLADIHDQAHGGAVKPPQATTGPDTLASAGRRDTVVVVEDDDDGGACPACQHPGDCACETCDCADPAHGAAMASSPRSSGRPPRDNLVRALPSAFEVRDSATGPSRVVGHFAVFNQWTRIDSAYEGRFMERMAPGAFAKTFGESRPKVLFQHGKDPQVGDKPLGIPDVLEEDREGARYEYEPFDTSYNRDLEPGLRAGAYGSSFRFRVVREDVVAKPARSAHNPDGLPERTVREAQVFEFGPVTFPAYLGATVSMRSMTDDYLRDILQAPAPSVDAGAPPHLAPERREPPAVQPSPASQETNPVTDPISRVDRPARIAEIRQRTEAIARDHSGVLPVSIQTEWDQLTSELVSLERDDRADAERRKFVEARSAVEASAERPEWQAPAGVGQIRQRVSDIYSLAEIRKVSRDEHDERQLLRDSAMREIERATFPTATTDKARCADAVDALVRNDITSEIARRVIITGSPLYRRELRKYIVTGVPSPDLMDRAAALTGLGATTTTGGYATVYELDPTILPTSNGAVNPYRRMARVVKTTHNEWRGVTSAGVVAAYDTEAAAATEQGPTLAQPAAIVQKAQTFITFSIEAGEDIDNLEGQLGVMIQDSKDVLEATQFTTGVGTTVYPQGVLVGATGTTNTATTLVLAAGDLYKLEGTLQPRFRPNARFLASRFIYNKVRVIDTAGGAQLWTQNLTVGLPNRVDGNTGYNLLGYPADECSGMPSTIAQNDLIAVLGDFNYFVVVDKIGLNIEVVPLMLNGATPSFPTGQRGLYAYWRNTSKVLASGAFNVLKVV